MRGRKFYILELIMLLWLSGRALTVYRRERTCGFLDTRAARQSRLIHAHPNCGHPKVTVCKHSRIICLGTRVSHRDYREDLTGAGTNLRCFSIRLLLLPSLPRLSRCLAQKSISQSSRMITPALLGLIIFVVLETGMLLLRN